MKELSIEEKAKAYDEAIKRGLDYIRHTPATEMVTRQDIFEAIFPELKESEDEKIRKEIITYLSTVDDKELIPYESWIAWLEKKGEQKPTEWSEEDEDMLYKATAVINRLCAEGKEYVWSVNTLKKLFYWFKSLKDRIQPKQEWREEDEYCRHQLIVFCENCMVPDSGAIRCANWLKSLKDRVLPQPKQEWSEDDETGLTNTIIMLKEGANLHFNKKDVTKAVDWLKSIKDRHTWKPSDLPHWKKSNLPNNTTTGFNSDYFCHKGYCINYEELFEKLPKDD